MKMCLKVRIFTEIYLAVRIYKYNSIVNGNTEREITFNWILMHCLNDKFVTQK